MDAAQGLELVPRKRDDEDLTGPQTGYVTADAPPAQPPAGQPPPPSSDNGHSPDPPAGTLESFMKLFGDGGTPGPKQR